MALYRNKKTGLEVSASVFEEGTDLTVWIKALRTLERPQRDGWFLDLEAFVERYEPLNTKENE